MTNTMLLTKRQILATIYHWGYSAGSLPRRSEIGADVTYCHIPAEIRSGPHTRARLTLGPKNGAGRQLYEMEFVS